MDNKLRNKLYVRLLNAMCLMLVAVCLTSCSSNSNSNKEEVVEPTVSNEGVENSSLADFNFDVDTITIKVYAGNDTYDTYTIADSSVVNDIVSMCEACDFQEVEQQDLMDGACDIFIIFDEDTVIGMYATEDYGNLEHEIEIIGTPVWLPNGFNDYITNLLDSMQKTN